MFKNLLIIKGVVCLMLTIFMIRHLSYIVARNITYNVFTCFKKKKGGKVEQNLQKYVYKFLLVVTHKKILEGNK